MKKLLAIMLLWLPFSLFAIIAIPRLLWAMLTDNEGVWRPVGRAMDKLMAAVLGFSGHHTLSAELGATGRMPWLAWFLDKVQPGHTQDAARHEGLIK